jgi:hypothetical protein
VRAHRDPTARLRLRRTLLVAPVSHARPKQAEDYAESSSATDLKMEISTRSQIKAPAELNVCGEPRGNQVRQPATNR